MRDPDLFEQLTKEQTTELNNAYMAARALMFDIHPFFAHLVYTLKFYPGEAEEYAVPTAAISLDASLYINYRFWKRKLKGSIRQLRFVLCHEILHPAMHFFDRIGPRNLAFFNYAHDYKINGMLLEVVENRPNLIEAPSIGLFDETLAELATEETYRIICERMKDKPNGSLVSGNQGEGRTAEDDIDDFQDAKPARSKSEKGKKAEKGDPIAIREMRDYWNQQLLQAKRIHESTPDKGWGSLPAGMQLCIDQLLTPVITWGDFIRQFVGQYPFVPDHTYCRLSRRSQTMGILLPGKKPLTGIHVAILWDTSGSMYNEHNRVFSELINLVTEMNLRVHVICCDAIVQNVFELTGTMSLDDVSPQLKGGGGSNFCPAFTYMEENEQEYGDALVIAFTDGAIYVPAAMPMFLRDVLWVSLGGPPPTLWGHAVLLNNNNEVTWQQPRKDVA